MKPFVESHKFVNCFNSSFVAANEDMWNGDPASDVINMTDWRDCVFYIQKGAGAVGTATITVESCDDVTPTTSTAIVFKYRSMTTATDTWGAWTNATVAGFTTTAAADNAYEIWVQAAELSGTDKYVRMQCTEVDSTAVDGGMGAILINPRYAEDVNRTVLT
jgi:hypothetical protein